ncbi:uncharacterized protein LOC128722675 [Anopheles nili]|uniref:uncharacterized protein LOC128722675 n=1 Tax=Anopheles nili TaxID=185578 RepID=UPI00237A4E46|nr:uncharacterized protein LOC128722675 [Anopheles nili]
MCGYHRAVLRLLVLVLAVSRLDSLPISSILDDDSDYDDSLEQDYDLVFDQRQNGTANVHVSLDGVMLAVQMPKLPPSALLTGASLLDMFVSSLDTNGGQEDESQEDSYDGVSGLNSSASSSQAPAKLSTTSTTTTEAPAVGPSLSGLPVTNNLFGQGLSFLFNTTQGGFPFRANHPEIPFVLTKIDSGEPQQQQQQQAGSPKRKHKRKYKSRLASMLRPLLKRTVPDRRHQQLS